MNIKKLDLAIKAAEDICELYEEMNRLQNLSNKEQLLMYKANSKLSGLKLAKKLLTENE